MDIKKALEEINLDVDSILDPTLKIFVIKLLNIIEEQAKNINELREENQKLRDENNRLKGEQGKPDIRKQTNSKRDISSEEERKRKKAKKKKGKKKGKIKVDRVKVCKVDKAQLPPDAIFKGHLKVLVQDITIKTDNIEFQKEIYYSPSLKRNFIASLPKGYEGEFGPNIKSLIISLYHDSKMTEPAIVNFLTNHEIMIADSTVSRILTNNLECFHQEKQEIIKEGLSSSVYQ